MVNVDGAGHVYVSGFSSFSFCALEEAKYDPLHHRGEFLSPLGSFNLDGELERPIGVEIDPIGNVCVCNNYSKDPPGVWLHCIFRS